MSTTFKPIIDLDTFKNLKPYYGYSRISQDGKKRPYFLLTTEEQKPTFLDGVEIQCSSRPSGYQQPDKIYMETTVSGWKGLQPKCDPENTGTYLFYCYEDTTNQYIFTKETYDTHLSHYKENR